MRSLFVIILLLAVTSTFSQTSQKIAHADWELIFSELPEYKTIESELKSFETQLQNQLAMRSRELEEKFEAYRNLPPGTAEPIRRDKETELASLRDNLQNFRQDAQASLQRKQEELVTPLFEKVAQAIENVAREEGYAYVVNPHAMNGGRLLLFADDRFDISALVLKKLGVTYQPKPKERAGTSR